MLTFELTPSPDGVQRLAGVIAHMPAAQLLEKARRILETQHNIEFVQVFNRDEINCRVYRRGSGYLPVKSCAGVASAAPSFLQRMMGR